MRGKRKIRRAWYQSPGLIPAHAGKTSPSFPSWMGMRDHPRACGENLGLGSRRHRYSGSSPRMRGKLFLVTLVCGGVGLIPAHAGKTSLSIRSVGPVPAHPRACGENSLKCCRGCERQGSSPRMRGKHAVFLDWVSFTRLIPAHAGKTASNSCLALWNRAHPRACGENSLMSSLCGRCTGSSPRMRGKLEGESRGRCQARLIPAHAGKTSSLLSRPL